MKFKPTPDQIRMAEATFTAMAFEQTVRPIVEAYEKAILEKHQFKIAKKWEDTRSGSAGEIILNPKWAYLLEDSDFSIYNAECKVARDAANLKVEQDDFCPLLVAENLRIQAENALINEIAKTPGLENLASGYLDLKQRASVLDLTLKMLAPFCSNANTILKRITA